MITRSNRTTAERLADLQMPSGEGGTPFDSPELSLAQVPAATPEGKGEPCGS